MNLNNIRMSVKLPVIFVTFSLVVALVISWVGYRDFRASLIQQKELLLETLVIERARTIEEWFVDVEKQLVNAAQSDTVKTAVQAFTTTFPLLMDDPEKELQQAYITDNPHPVGEKDQLDRAEATIPYNFQHANFHGFFRAMNQRIGLYDIFLVDMEGNVVYSVFKELDYATNLEGGAYRSSGLADAFRAGKDATPGQAVFVDFAPYAPSGNAPAAFMATQITTEEGTVAGVLIYQLPTNLIQSIVNNPQGLGETGEITLIGEDGIARSASRFDGGHQVLTSLTLNVATDETLDSGLQTFRIGVTSLAGREAMIVNYPVEITGNAWVLLAEIDMAEVLADANAKGLRTIAMLAVALAIVGVCGWYMSRAFGDPLNVVVRAMNQVSQRDYDVTLPDATRQDEIGDLGRALTLMVDRLRAFDEQQALEQKKAKEQQYAVDSLGTGLKRLAEGNISRSISEPFAREYEALRADYNNTIDTLGETIANLKDFASTIAKQTTKMGEEAHELSRRTENQASTLEETAAAIDQITETIGANTEELKSAERLILETDTQAKEGRLVVEKTTKAMDKIEESAEEIGSIIRVVDDIAFQTNLLALNAGVEAARAGDAGRGFAVVASEVRQLAMRSTEAVSQIKALIETSNTNVGTGVNLVRETEKMLLGIVQRMEGISTAISSVASGAAEQSSSISEINAGVNNLDRVTQQNAMMVENTNSSAQALSAEADNLLEILSKFEVNERRDNVVKMARVSH